MLKPAGRAGPIASTGGSRGPGLQPEELCDVCAQCISGMLLPFAMLSAVFFTIYSGFHASSCSYRDAVIGGGGPLQPPWLTQTLGVGGLDGQPPGSRGGGGGAGSVGTPTYIAQNDPHDMLIILNMHKWGKKNCKKKLPVNSGSHQPRSDPQVGSGSKSFSAFFIHF